MTRERMVSAVILVISDRWSRGHRVDDGSRCVAAYVARSWGYRGKDIAAALGYAGASSVAQAVKRVGPAAATSAGW